jgi:hypothetical protein
MLTGVLVVWTGCVLLGLQVWIDAQLLHETAKIAFWREGPGANNGGTLRIVAPVGTSLVWEGASLLRTSLR